LQEVPKAPSYQMFPEKDKHGQSNDLGMVTTEEIEVFLHSFFLSFFLSFSFFSFFKKRKEKKRKNKRKEKE
jgi:hypothetical protein